MVDVSDPSHPREVYFGGAQFSTLKEMTNDLNIDIYPEDKYNIFPDPSLGIGSRIEIQRALLIEVNDGGKNFIVRTWQKQIDGLLTEQNIILGEQDKIDPAKSTWLRENLKINITRVAETELKEEEVVVYKTINKDDPNLEKGKSRVEQVGKNGTKVKTYIVRRENGQEVSRRLVNEEITTKPQDKIVYNVTKIVVLGRGNATWYDLISGNTAASNTLPRYSYVRVTAVNSGKSVVVKIIDAGIQSDAVIDLSADAFSQLAPLGAGVISVVLTKE